MDHARHCMEIIGYFRRTYRPDHAETGHHFDRDLDRVIHEVTTLAYRNAQEPFAMELYLRRNDDLRAAGLNPLPPKGLV